MDGAETDVDCGGTEISVSCPLRCGDQQACLIDCDCEPALLCQLQAGVRLCTAPLGPDGGAANAPPRNCGG